MKAAIRAAFHLSESPQDRPLVLGRLSDAVRRHVFALTRAGIGPAHARNATRAAVQQAVQAIAQDAPEVRALVTDEADRVLTPVADLGASSAARP